MQTYQESTMKFYNPETLSGYPQQCKAFAIKRAKQLNHNDCDDTSW